MHAGWVLTAVVESGLIGGAVAGLLTGGSPERAQFLLLLSIALGVRILVQRAMFPDRKDVP